MLGTLGFALQIASTQERTVTVKKKAKSKQNTTKSKPHGVLIPQSGIFQIIKVFP